MVITGLKLNLCKSAVVMSKTRPNILYAAVGIHPHFVKDDWNDKTTDELEDLLKSPEVVAIGECGLDFNKDYSPRELQETAFKKQVCKILQISLFRIWRKFNVQYHKLYMFHTLAFGNEK